MLCVSVFCSYGMDLSRKMNYLCETEWGRIEGDINDVSQKKKKRKTNMEREKILTLK